jgi:hypothetical protein
VRWEGEDGRFIYCAIRRRMDSLTGEVGVASEPLELEQLPFVNAPKDANLQGSRIQLGLLIHGHDKWWSTGGTEPGFHDRIDWLAQQLGLQLQMLVNAARSRAS